MAVLPRRIAGILLTGVALSALAACSTVSSGMGGGELERRNQADAPVLFSWRSQDGGNSGTLVATLPNATYEGRFFQITQQTEREVAAPLWEGWSEGWRDWSYGVWAGPEPYGWTQFTTRYTGKVLANLTSDTGRRMRCRLHLTHPARGMAGGGEG